MSRLHGRRRLFLAAVTLSLALAASAGRAQGPSPVPGNAQPLPSAQPTPSAQPGDEAFTLQTFLELRDPFRRLQLKGPDDPQKADEAPELERYPIDQFRLVGIVTGARRNKAMVTSPGGKMFIITEATRIGNRGGQVRRITANQIIVEETSYNLLGQEEKSSMTIGFAPKKDKL